jgi:DNA-binding NarL/FixJ family response regulator
MLLRILLADNHALVRQGLRRILETHPGLQVVAEASSGLEAVTLAHTHGLDLVRLDVGMKSLNGLEALTQLRRSFPRLAVVMLSMHADERYVLRAVREGASGYVLKDCVEEELITAILEVRRGRRFFSPEVDCFLRLRKPEDTVDDRYERLTGRERHI